MSCIPTNVIGLSETACACFDTDKPATASDSLSGIMLDSKLNLGTMLENSGCENGSMWDILIRSRDEAIQATEFDLGKNLESRTTKRSATFSGVLGDRKFDKTLPISTTYAAYKVDAFSVQGACMVIKSIDVLMDTTTTFDVELWSNISGAPLETWTVNATANTLTLNPVTTLEVPLYSKYCDNLEYYFVYQPSGFLPKNNGVDCGCGGKKATWKRYAKLYGATGDLTTDIEDWSQSNNANGLIIDVDFKCKTSSLLCDRSFDFTEQGDQFDRALAWAVLYKTAELAIDKILRQTKPNIESIGSLDEMAENRNEFIEEYANNVMYAGRNFDLSNTDCLVCRQHLGGRKVTI